MSASSDKQVKVLLDAVNAHCNKTKGKHLDGLISATSLLMAWYGYLRSSLSNNIADRLLESAQGATIEAACCISLALVRPAIFSIRAQLELSLAWLYYNDHGVEWRFFEKTGKDYPMRASLVKYMQSNNTRYTERSRLLQKTKTRIDDDPYALLSIHVHSFSAHGGPINDQISSVVQSDAACDECVQLQRHVAEYLADTFSSWYADQWHDLPNEIKGHLTKRLAPKDLKDFCSA
jgi:hypothetical protein